LSSPGRSNCRRTVEREVDGKRCSDYKLTRFACYLVSMNGDVKKPQVAKAQAYFAAMAEAVQKHLQKAENVERLLIRDDVSDREQSLARTAHAAGVQNYAYFHNKGYLGMYNMSLGNRKEYKGVNFRDCLLDFMGKEELAANLFRITQTEAKIRSDSVTGQTALEKTAFQVGRKVRHTIEEISGTLPEDLPIAEDIDTVKRGLKQVRRELVKLDNPKQAKLLPE
jgi:DNA-damage-inducible protein D